MNRRYDSVITASIFLLFTVIFCLISLVNHYQFRTYALDLGMYNHALYSYAHLKQAFFTLGIDGNETPFLAAHFSVITMLLAPLYYLFGSYTLLIIQIAAILAGGLAVYRYATDTFEGNRIIPWIILIQFFSLWGLYSALAFDYHENVIAAMLVLWFVYALGKRKLLLSAILMVLILLCKEIMAVWMFFIIAGLMIKSRKKQSREFIRFEIPALLFSLLYGVAVIGFIMPQLQGSESNLQLSRYSQYGGSLGEMAATFLQRPQLLFQALFSNTLGDPEYNGIKSEFHIMVLVSAGICLFLRPAYLVMLIPAYLTKFLSNDYALWGINYQYSIEFVPIISLAFIDLLSHAGRLRMPLAVLMTLSTIWFNFSSMRERDSKWYNPQNTQLYSRSHYNADMNLREVREAMSLIGSNSRVSVSSCLAPRLAFREKIYHFPVVKDADYIMLITRVRSAYPLRDDEMEARCNEYRNSDMWVTIYDADNILVFKKK